MGLIAGQKIQVTHKENLSSAKDAEAHGKQWRMHDVKALGWIYTNLCPGMTDADDLMAVRRRDVMSPLDIMVLRCLSTISVQKHHANPPQTKQKAGF